MSLIDCPACGNKTSSQAFTCPQCGHPIAANAPQVPPAMPTAPAAYVQSQSPASGWRSVGCVLVILAVSVTIGGCLLLQTEVGKDVFTTSRKLLRQVSPPSENSLIIGKWQFPNLPNTLEFFSDGLMRETGTAKSTDSQYKLLGNGRMHTTSPGLFYGETEQDWNIKFSTDGDSLTLTPNAILGIPITLKRIE